MQSLFFIRISVREVRRIISIDCLFCLAVRESQPIRAEIITTLAVADRLYSEVEENVPDPSPLTANRKEIDIILEQVCS